MREFFGENKSGHTFPFSLSREYSPVSEAAEQSQQRNTILIYETTQLEIFVLLTCTSFPDFQCDSKNGFRNGNVSELFISMRTATAYNVQSGMAVVREIASTVIFGILA